MWRHPACIRQAPTQQALLPRTSRRAQHTPGVIARGGIGFPRSERADQDKAHAHTHANFSCCPFYHSGKALVMVNHRKRALKLFSISIIIIIIIFLHCSFSMSFKKTTTPNQKTPDKQTNKPTTEPPAALPQPAPGAGRAAGCDEEEEGGGLEVAGAPSIPGHTVGTG